MYRKLAWLLYTFNRFGPRPVPMHAPAPSAGFRVSPLAADGTTDWQTVFHISVGWDPYPLPVRPTVYFGYGRRMVPTDGAGSADEWRLLVPWPQLQVYLLHSGGFNWT